MLGDRSFGPIPSLNQSYRVSDYLGAPLDCPDHSRQEIIDLIHFYLPLDPMAPDTSLTRYHRNLLTHSSPPSAGFHTQDSWPISESFIEYFAACLIHVAKHASLAESFRKKRQSHGSSSAVASTGGGGALKNYLFQDDSSVLSASSSPDEEEGEGSTVSRLGTKSHKWGQMEEFCSRNSEASHLSPVEKVWLIIARTDGECGQLLGQAVVEKYDGIRAWVLSYMVRHIALFDTLPATAAGRRNSSRKASGIDIATPVTSPAASPLDQQTNHFFFLCIALELFQLKRNEICRHQHLPAAAGYRMDFLPRTPPNSSNMRPTIGRLIPVHCGHNGWPSSDEMSQFSECFSEIEFVQDGDSSRGAGRGGKERRQQGGLL